VLILGVLIVIVSGFGLLKLLKPGIVLAETREVSMNKASIFGRFFSGFVSSLLAGIALLPSAA
jgi:hypothetical protein